jgi:predicted regulator of amino acid metabolism with ACT domain
MWNKIQQLLGPHHPERLKIARLCIENGLAIRDDGIYLNQIEIPTARIARAAGVDRRTVVETVRMIQSDKGLRAIFGQLQSAGLSLRGVAKHLGLGVVEITAKDPKDVGILAGASKLLADAGISIRQALVDDPELSPEPKLTLIGDTSVPGNIIPEMLKIKGVTRISVY